MKVSVEKVTPPFKPVNLTITFESKVEVDEFYAIFNLSVLTDTLSHIDQHSIREQLRVVAPSASNDEVFTKLNKAMKSYT